MKTLLTFLTFLLLAGSALGQAQGVSVRSTNGFSYGTLTGQRMVATNFTGNGAGLTNLSGTNFSNLAVQGFNGGINNYAEPLNGSLAIGSFRDASGSYSSSSAGSISAGYFRDSTNCYVNSSGASMTLVTYEFANDSYADSTSGSISMGDLEVADGSYFTSLYGSISAGSLYESQNSFIDTGYGGLGMGQLDVAFGSSISSFAGGLAGVSAITSSNVDVIAISGVAAISANNRTNVAVTSVGSLVVGSPTNNFSGAYTNEIVLIKSSGEVLKALLGSTPYNGAGLTNIPAAAISNVATNNGNNQFSASQTITGNLTNTGFSSTTTNYSTKLRVGGAAESSDAINVTGTINASSTINAATDIQAANRVRVGGSAGMYFESGIFNSLYIGNAVSTVTNIVLYGRAGGVSNFPTNAAINHIPGNPPTIRFWNATNGPADVIVSGSLTTTNGVFGASGSIMLTTNVSVAMAANTYTNVGNYDYTTVFGNVTASSDALTNGTAGRYFIAIHAAFAGAGAASLYEGAVFTNTVECTIIEWQRDVTTTFGSASASGILTLPAGCRVEYKIKSPDAETGVFSKLGLTMMGAN